MKKNIEVVGAVIVADGEILCAQRGPHGPLGGKWEFPGGKVEGGESPREALEREIHEELECVVRVGEQVTMTVHEYDFAIIALTTFYCQLLDGEPHLTEHAAVQWLPPSRLAELDWAAADVPAVRLIEMASV